MTPGARGDQRILYVTDGFAPYVIGGMQAYARRQLETLAASGYTLTSISTGPVEPSGLAWRNIHLPWPARARIDRLNPWRYVRDLQRFSTSVAEVADAVAPHLIYTEGPLLHAYLHRAERPARTLFNPHGLEMFQDKGSLTDNLKSWPLRGIVADHARRCDRVICLSERGELQRILRQSIGLSDASIRVLPNTAPAQPAATPRTAPTNGSRFLFVGRDEPRKALPLLLDAIRAVPGARLDIVGVNPHAEVASDSIRFHGPVRDPAQIANHYRDADFLVVPSHAEGMPTVILEAFAAGLPVIATDVGANADLVREGETGFLVPRGDRAALTEAMRRAMRIGAADYAALSAASLQTVRSRFSPEIARDKLLTLLDAELNGGKGG